LPINKTQVDFVKKDISDREKSTLQKLNIEQDKEIDNNFYRNKAIVYKKKRAN